MVRNRVRRPEQTPSNPFDVDQARAYREYLAQVEKGDIIVLTRREIEELVELYPETRDFIAEHSHWDG